MGVAGTPSVSTASGGHRDRSRMSVVDDTRRPARHSRRKGLPLASAMRERGPIPRLTG
jgi:hypothetical protein